MDGRPAWFLGRPRQSLARKSRAAQWYFDCLEVRGMRSACRRLASRFGNVRVATALNPGMRSASWTGQYNVSVGSSGTDPLQCCFLRRSSFCSTRTASDPRMGAAAHESFLVRRSRNRDSTSRCAPGFSALAILKSPTRSIEPPRHQEHQEEKQRIVSPLHSSLVLLGALVVNCTLVDFHPSSFSAAGERGTVPFCSEDCAKSGQSPAALKPVVVRTGFSHPTLGHGAHRPCQPASATPVSTCVRSYLARALGSCSAVWRKPICNSQSTRRSRSSDARDTVHKQPSRSASPNGRGEDRRLGPWRPVEHCSRPL